MTTAARGARRRWGVEKKLSYYSSVAGGQDFVEIWYAFRNPFGMVYSVVTGGVSLRVRTCTSHRCHSETARPIAFKFAVWLGDYSLRGFHMSWVTFHIAACTCARAHPIYISQERLGRLRSNLLCICDPISCDPISLRGGRFARWAGCMVGSLRGGRFARLAGWRGWRFARLAVCAVGGLRGWRFARLAVCAIGGLRGWRFARLAVCAVDGLRDWRFARWAV